MATPRRQLTAVDTAPALPPADEADRLFEEWLAGFGAAVERRDAQATASCLVEDGYWRDILTLDWGFATHSGREEIVQALERGLGRAGLSRVRAARERMPPRFTKRGGVAVVEAFF